MSSTIEFKDQVRPCAAEAQVMEEEASATFENTDRNLEYKHQVRSCTAEVPTEQTGTLECDDDEEAASVLETGESLEFKHQCKPYQPRRHRTTKNDAGNKEAGSKRQTALPMATAATQSRAFRIPMAEAKLLGANTVEREGPQPPTKCCSKRRAVAAVFFVAIVLVGSTVGAYFGLIRNDDRTAVSRAELIAGLINSASRQPIRYPPRSGFATKDEILDAASPEERALWWLIDDDPARLQPTDSVGKQRILQRFSLALLWYGEARPQWKNSTRWLSETHECTWHGIQCQDAEYFGTNDTTRVVTEMFLPDNNVGGSLAADLSLLTSLRVFDLSSNRLNGPIPGSLNSWQFLERFDVTSNALAGTIPSLDWSALSHFAVGFNSLSGQVPNSVVEWTHMQVFEVNDNYLSGSIPSGVGAWRDIVDFAADDNDLTGVIPKGVEHWTDLQTFRVSRNKLHGSLPFYLSRWKKLVAFAVHHNSLTGTLPNIGTWKQLTDFACGKNSLSGTIPSTIAGWTNIRDAFFDENDLTGSIPDELCSVASLRFLRVDCGEIKCSCCTGTC